jgi:hypothetical protein
MKDLFSNPSTIPAPHSGSDTSRGAALSIEPNAGTLRRKVLDRLKAVWPYGMTDEQMQDELYIAQNTQRPRRRELVQAGLVYDSGRRSLTRSGRSAIIWIAKP